MTKAYFLSHSNDDVLQNRQSIENEIHWTSDGRVQVEENTSPVGAQSSRAMLHELRPKRYALAMPLGAKGYVCNLIDRQSGIEKHFTVLPPDCVFAGLEQNQSYRDSSLYKLTSTWSSFFDECIFEQGGNSLSWNKIRDKINDLNSNNEPQMSLIVRIVDELSSTVKILAQGLRRILKRQRSMLPSERIEEFDNACLEWLVRQPGCSVIEKSAYNNQRLKGVNRKEYVDTLENRVLKDFLERCIVEGEIYIASFAKSNPNSERIQKVKSYSLLCKEILKSPFFITISKITGIIKPNYVLQSDSKYKKIWKWYYKLLRQQKEADEVWKWQPFLWKNVVEVIFNIALDHLCNIQNHPNISIKKIADNFPSIYPEQVNGNRLDKCSSCGPYLVTNKREYSDMVLEVVSGNDVDSYLNSHSHLNLLSAKKLLPDLMLIFYPLLKEQQQTAVFIWNKHTAADGVSDNEILGYMDSIRNYLTLYSEYNDSNSFRYLGFCTVNSVKEHKSPIQNSMILKLEPEVNGWNANIEIIEKKLKSLFMEIV